jgi:hypothetical protein
MSGTELMDVVPTLKLTLPVGIAVPAELRTLTVNCVVPVRAMLVGVAPTLVRVGTAGAVTVTATEPEELLKFPVAT